PDRCTSSSQLASFASTCSAAVVSNADPFDGGSNTVVTCMIDLDDFGGASAATLLDSCNYPSATVNSDPSDCIITRNCNNSTDCKDDNVCTTDTCSTGICVHTPAASGTMCRASAGACDVAETCDGITNLCPSDGFAASSVVCRAAAGDCDVAETCTGTSAACPADQLAASTVTCPQAAGHCHLAEHST